MKSILSAVRFFLTICLCAVMLFSFAMPAFAKTTKPDEAESINLAKKMEQRGRDILEAGKVPGLEEEIQKTNEGGLNVVQGKSGIQDMKRPSNTSKDVTSVEEQIEKTLEKAQDKVTP